MGFQVHHIKMKSKKAFLLGEHIVNILIAVLCIIILIGVGVKLYNIYNERELNIARGHLNEISGLVESIKEGVSREYIMLTPEGWVLTAWPSHLSMLNIDLSPDICLSNKWKNCICLCKTDRPEKTEKVLADCNLNNICKEIKYNQFILSPASASVNFPISVDKDLVADKKSLNIYLESKDKLVITTK